ncbi:MAG: SDR family oxidoreductase [Chloroflexota bacterium]|nr:SDR family oxidoreductase [Chloroflexota bacterium]
MDLGYKGKVAVISGAGRGLGRTIALTLAEEGATVAVNDFYLERAEEVAKEIKAKGGEAIGVQADVTDTEAVIAMMKKVVDTLGRVDIVVHNAGIPAGLLETAGLLALAPLFHETDKETWDKWVNIDFYGLLNLAKAAIPHMIEQGSGGRIVSVGSDAGRIGEQRTVVYSGAKAGTYGFLKAVAKEVARYGITANAVVSSAMDDTFLSTLTGADSPEAQERRKAVMRQYPLARARGGLGTTQDMANAVAFVASERASWITGQLLSVNGGYCMVD